MRQFHLTKGSQRKIRKERIVGFDVETADDNQSFVCACLSFHDHEETFFSREELAKRLVLRDMRNRILVATNLSFDFCAAFFATKHKKGFRLLMRGSNMLSAKTYIGNGKFESSGAKNSLLFIDTMNYVPFSVAKLGELVGEPKLAKPAALGRHPRSEEERDELVTYNIVDARISRKAMITLFSAFEELGASFRSTIASTSLSLFRNKYLKETIWGESVDCLDFDFSGYYGGRVEALRRGSTKDMKLYDINSLYPAMMRRSLPDPSSRRITRKKDGSLIRGYEGMARCTVDVPRNGRLPVLPIIHEQKLVFPTGKLTGTWTHYELREAQRRGAVITDIEEIHYFLECKPYLSEYVDDLYEKRRKYQREGNEVMQLACKLAMNSLYGKFGQKFRGRDNLVPEGSMTVEELDKYTHYERIGDFFRVVTEEGRPSSCCHPIWAAHITAMGRIEIACLAERYDASYMDTDSIITKETIPSSTALGELKLERVCDDVLIIRPKFYAVRGEGFDYAKSKGVGLKLVFDDAIKVTISGGVTYKKLLKMREALRRGLKPLSQIVVEKKLGLEDTKRDWDNDEFVVSEWVGSKPLHLSALEEPTNLAEEASTALPLPL